MDERRRTTMSAVPASSDRRYKLAEVTEASRDGWNAFADRHGTTPTALAEVIGLRLGELVGSSEMFAGDEAFDLELRDCVDEARRLASERRRRAAR